MHCSFSTTVIAAFSMLSVVCAGPIATRQVCGAAPVGTVAQTPLLQPTGITTASDCATQCRGNPSCLSFLFGLVDGVDKCILYSVPASSLPPQTNLVAYDIACTSIPTVVPTAANPGGLRTRQAQGTHANPLNEAPEGAPAPIATPKVDDLSACLAACKGNPSCVAYTFQSGVCKLFGPTNAKRAEGAATGAKNAAQDTASGSVGTHEAPLNAVPEGSPAPISTPKVANLAACLTACKGNPSCVAYTFKSGVCKLFGPTNAKRAEGAATGAGNAAQATASGSVGAVVQTAVGTHEAPLNAVPAGSPTPISTPTVDDLSACLTACKGNPSCVAYTFESGVCKLFGATTGDGNAAQDTASGSVSTVLKTAVATHAAPLNAVPAGSPAPIDTPEVDDLAACLAACKGNPSCIAYTFESGVCKLFD
ncbi:hypothetical protein VE03_09345 [Pseudogymnoascus sp. 23342-1-I1]|nr:hypothetical protein VE03_09345 [Pseudogymnoascus sp. 23342-1-I1]